MLRLATLLFVALCFGSPAVANEVLFQRENVVVIRTEDAKCGMSLGSVVVERGESNLTLLYDAAERKVHFALSSEVTSSLPSSGTTELELVFILDGVYDDAWGRLTFAYFEKEGVWTFNRFFTGEAAAQILDDLSKATHVALQHKGDPFTGAKLSNSARAIDAMRRCAFEEAGLNPRDPFAQ